MKEGKARVELGDGLVQYMAAADETMRELRAADSPLLRALLQYDAYFRRDLWEHVSPTPAFAFVLFLNAYQMFLGAARMALGAGRKRVTIGGTVRSGCCHHGAGSVQ